MWLPLCSRGEGVAAWLPPSIVEGGKSSTMGGVVEQPLCCGRRWLCGHPSCSCIIYNILTQYKYINNVTIKENINNTL
jgi:hypothetical protein